MTNIFNVNILISRLPFCSRLRITFSSWKVTRPDFWPLTTNWAPSSNVCWEATTTSRSLPTTTRHLRRSERSEIQVHFYFLKILQLMESINIFYHIPYLNERNWNGQDWLDFLPFLLCKYFINILMMWAMFHRETAYFSFAPVIHKTWLNF